MLGSLLPYAAADAIARDLADEAEGLLLEVKAVEARSPGPGHLTRLLRAQGLPSEWLAAGLQALQWLADERGLAGPAESDGLPWVFPMHELFERWVEAVVRAWARGFGGVVRSARTAETLIPCTGREARQPA